MGHRSYSRYWRLRSTAGRPPPALQATLQNDGERLCEHVRLGAKVSTITSHGRPLCNATATMKLRLATAEEVVLYRRGTQSTEPSSDTNVVDLDG
jgi:hypothetical protein